MEGKGKDFKVTGWEDIFAAFGGVALLGIFTGCVLFTVVLVLAAVLRLLGVL